MNYSSHAQISSLFAETVGPLSRRGRLPGAPKGRCNGDVGHCGVHLSATGALERHSHRRSTAHVERYGSAADPAYCDGEGAESFADFLRRVEAALARLATQTNRP